MGGYCPTASTLRHLVWHLNLGRVPRSRSQRYVLHEDGDAMSKLLARLFFVMMPALVFAVVAAAVFNSFGVGLVVAAFMAGLGMDVTKPRPERGES